MKYALAIILGLACSVILCIALNGCSLGETNEQEAARFEAAERKAGYPAREGSRPGAQTM